MFEVIRICNLYHWFLSARLKFFCRMLYLNTDNFFWTLTVSQYLTSDSPSHTFSPAFVSGGCSTGGPGSGKSTQCSNISAEPGFCHLSVGDLLQEEVECGSEDGYSLLLFHWSSSYNKNRMLWFLITISRIWKGLLVFAHAVIGWFFTFVRTMIMNLKREGKLVPSEIVVKLLRQAMQRTRNKKFLIDGFPRNEENLAAAENTVCHC